MRVIRWPDLDEIESKGKIVDEFYTSTNVGPILTASLFPLNARTDLEDLKKRIDEKKKELAKVEGEIYPLRNKWRNIQS